MAHQYVTFILTEVIKKGRLYPRQLYFSMKWLHTIALILVAVGALNWGLIGLGGLIGSDLNLVAMILGSMPMLENLVYLLVGLSAVYELATHRARCRECASSSSSMM